jgi:hypothetical protein
MLKMELWGVCRPVVADLHHFYEQQDPYLNQSNISDLDLDPHQNEKMGPDPHQHDANLCTIVQNSLKNHFTCF